MFSRICQWNNMGRFLSHVLNYKFKKKVFKVYLGIPVSFSWGFGGQWFWGTGLFQVSCLVMFTDVCKSSPHCSLDVCGLCSDIFSVILHITYWYFLSFFVLLVIYLSLLLIFTKNQLLLSFSLFLFVFPALIFIVACLLNDLVYFFLF